MWLSFQTFFPHFLYRLFLTLRTQSQLIQKKSISNNMLQPCLLSKWLEMFFSQPNEDACQSLVLEQSTFNNKYSII